MTCPTFPLLIILLGCLFLDGTEAESECYEHFDCLSPNRNGEFLQYIKLNSTVPNWYELCNCDSYCHIFGDCCRDAPVLETLWLQEWSFVKIRLSTKITFMSLLKNKCPQGSNASNYVKTMCEQTSLSPVYDYLLPDIEQFLLLDYNEEFKNWHVTSRESLVTYRNLYCSVCNNDTDVESWNQKLRCSNSSSSSAKCTAMYHQTSPDIIGKEKLKRTPLQNKVYSSCNLGWYKMNIVKQTSTVLDTIKKCLIYYEPVVVKDAKAKKFIVFKNKYCAQCNEYDLDSLQCPGSSIDQPTQIPASFNVLTNFDTNYRQGSVISEEDNRTCDAGSVFNPLVDKCQIVNASLHASSLENKQLPDSPIHSSTSSDYFRANQLLIVLPFVSLFFA